MKKGEINNVVANFRKKINILLVDDNRQSRSLVREVLDSPLINIVEAESLSDARSKIVRPEYRWHLWIIDIDLGNNESGLTLMDEYADFQYVIIISGLKNMKIASEAAKKGALQIYDKSSDILFTEFRHSVYRISTISFLLKGNRSEFLNVFLPLHCKVLTTPQDWAHEACVGLRHLEKICATNIGIPPRSVLHIYYYINCLLYYDQEETMYDFVKDEKKMWKSIFSISHHSFIRSILMNRIDYLNKVLPD